MKMCGIYFRDRTIYLFCQSETVFGVWIACEPMLKISRNITHSLLGEAVINTLDFSQSRIPHPDNLQPTDMEFLKFIGFKRWRAFARKAFCISVTFDGTDVEVTPYAPDRRGNFFPLLDKAVKCALKPEEVGNLLFSLFPE